MNLFLIFFSAFLVNNIILIRFIGLCPYFGVSKRLSTALGMGMAVVFVMVVSSWISWMVYHWVLEPNGLVYLRTASFIVVIASLVQFLEMFLKKNFPHLYTALGIYLPLITTNCAILGVAFLNIDYGHSFIETTLFSVGTAFGFTLVISLIAALRERLDLAPVPESFKGNPIAFITASLMALAFLGFVGLFGLSI